MGHLLKSEKLDSSDELGLIEVGDMTGREKGTEMKEHHLARRDINEWRDGVIDSTSSIQEDVVSYSNEDTMISHLPRCTMM